MNDFIRLNQLLELVRSGQAEAEDYRELRALISADPDGETIRQIHAFHSAQAAAGPARTGGLQPYDHAYWQSVLDEIMAADKMDTSSPMEPIQGDPEGQPDIRPVHRGHFLPRRTRWAAAAIGFILLGAGAIWLHNRQQPPIAATRPKQQDIAPGGNKAILTLAGGQQVILDSAANGTLAQQGNTRVQKLAGGQLAYLPGTGQTTGPIIYNTLTTPRGGQYQLTLPDGTKVWLNAASSITYPTTFTGSKRQVSITGEAYFEVTKNKSAPFRVSVNNQSEVEVLGTRFNINSYDDEPVTRTTLLEGSIRAHAAGNNPSAPSLILQPGQQAIRPQAQARVDLNDHADLDKTMAWKNGLFNFEGASLQEVMKQLRRWYDLDIVYEKGIPDIRFGGEMSRNVPLSDVLVGLKDMKIHFRIEEGRRLIVTP